MARNCLYRPFKVSFFNFVFISVVCIVDAGDRFGSSDPEKCFSLVLVFNVGNKVVLHLY